jgi:hypothetical protein
MFKVFVLGDEDRDAKEVEDETQADEGEPHENSINLLWDILSHLFNDEEEDETEEFHVYQHTYNTRIKGAPSYPPPTTLPPKKSSTSDTLPPKKISTNDKPISLKNKQPPSNVSKYSLVEDMKRAHANRISLYDLTRLTRFRTEVCNVIKGDSFQPNVASNPKHTSINVILFNKKFGSTTPLFLLTFEIFNMNVHNFMVDSGASSNIMPYIVC